MIRLVLSLLVGALVCLLNGPESASAQQRFSVRSTTKSVFGVTQRKRNITGMRRNIRNIYGMRASAGARNKRRMFGVRSLSKNRLASGRNWGLRRNRIFGGRALSRNPFRNTYSPFGRAGTVRTTVGSRRANVSSNWSSQIGGVPPFPGGGGDVGNSGFVEF